MYCLFRRVTVAPHRQLGAQGMAVDDSAGQRSVVGGFAGRRSEERVSASPPDFSFYLGSCARSWWVARPVRIDGYLLEQGINF